MSIGVLIKEDADLDISTVNLKFKILSESYKFQKSERSIIILKEIKSPKTTSRTAQ